MQLPRARRAGRAGLIWGGDCYERLYWPPSRAAQERGLAGTERAGVKNRTMVIVLSLSGRSPQYKPEALASEPLGWFQTRPPFPFAALNSLASASGLYYSIEIRARAGGNPG